MLALKRTAARKKRKLIHTRISRRLKHFNRFYDLKTIKILIL
jgi:hypothetical protein